MDPGVAAVTAPNAVTCPSNTLPVVGFDGSVVVAEWSECVSGVWPCDGGPYLWPGMCNNTSITLGGCPSEAAEASEYFVVEKVAPG